MREAARKARADARKVKKIVSKKTNLTGKLVPTQKKNLIKMNCLL